MVLDPLMFKSRVELLSLMAVTATLAAALELANLISRFCSVVKRILLTEISPPR